jgi:predicted DCC family thiol-disulfide oxidoreductase YuxK
MDVEQKTNGEHPVILFDGLCNFCDASVQFVIRRDVGRRFRFAALQSEFGQGVLKEFGLPSGELGSFILLEHGKIWTKSGGGLRVFVRFGGFWRLLGVFLLVPAFIRDWVYDLIARNRYRWFGKKEVCMIPSAEIRSLFYK